MFLNYVFALNNEIKFIWNIRRVLNVPIKALTKSYKNYSQSIHERTEGLNLNE